MKADSWPWLTPTRSSKFWLPSTLYFAGDLRIPLCLFPFLSESTATSQVCPLLAQIFANQFWFTKSELQSAKLSRLCKTRLERPTLAILASLWGAEFAHTLSFNLVLQGKQLILLLGSKSLFGGTQTLALRAQEEGRCLVRCMKLLLRKIVAERGRKHKGPLNSLHCLSRSGGLEGQ